MKIMSFAVVGVIVGIGLFGGSVPAQAYEAQAIALSPTHTLLVTTYTETLLNRDGIIPLAAAIGIKGDHTPLTASFQVKGADDTTFGGQTHGSFILSSNPIMHGGYTMTAGKKATLMLVVLISHEATTANNIRAHLTSLPVLLTENGKVESQTIKNY